MYQQEKKWVTVTLWCVFLLISTFSVSGHQQTTVEEIYSSIRYTEAGYSYDESIVTFTNKGMTIVGSLVIPRTPQRCPIIITLNGFVGVRDEGEVPGTGEGFMKRASHKLAAHGIASLRIDYRGQGESDGEYDMTRFSTQVSDGLAAIKYVRTNLRRYVQIHKIGLLGYSQGGVIGPEVAVRSNQIKSMVFWSPVTMTYSCYEMLLTHDGIMNGLSIKDDEAITLPIYYGFEGPFYCDVTLRKGFFQDLYRYNPIATISKYKKPLMILMGNQDILIKPPEEMGNLWMKFHEGEEKFLLLDMDHELNFYEPGAEKLDDAISWMTAWFIKTLNQCEI